MSRAILLLLCLSGSAYAQVPERIIDVPRGPSRTRLTVRGGAGFAYRYGFVESFLAAVGQLGLGVEDARVGGGGLLQLEAGGTAVGLSYEVIKVGPYLEWRVTPRTRWSAGLDIGALILQRAATPGSLWTMLIGVHIDGTIDLWTRLSGGGLYFGTRLGGDFLTAAPSPAMLLTTLTLGYRS
jgi:hypothetical protein